ncbi:MAG: 3-deoxy-7-phosphoheptulonate synthase [Bacteroidetes bacterium GWF2_33_16]|nr:MAG: 3-deoxy-7-phosphoheptulonate synthase [Bacteroidetes bacterium GWE2_32_14]OFY04573.1 MAG: 3-deoxy-7-phosphoheptulonate synthase [Bacteroidetes bacterium GWF2_33_16]
MIIQFEKNITSTQRERVLEILSKNAFKTREAVTQLSNYLVAIGKSDFDIRIIGNMEGVNDVHKVNDDYKLVSSKWKVKPTQIEIDADVTIGSNGFTVMAGPCSIENENQIEKMVEFLKTNNINIMRGGVFKPRSSPYSFRGVGIDGLKIFYKICKANGIKIITEVMELEQIDDMYDYIDIFQVGARNSQNFNLLDALGKVDKPVMIKRGLSGTIDELLYSAEYVFSGGNEKILLCERGIRTYEKAYRNTFDINAIPILKEKSHLPVIIDPSHGTGQRSLIEPITLAGIMAGADGAIIEIHEQPEKAMSDGQQSLNFNETQSLLKKIRETSNFKNQFLS